MCIDLNLSIWRALKDCVILSELMRGCSFTYRRDPLLNELINWPLGLGRASSEWGNMPTPSVGFRDSYLHLWREFVFHPKFGTSAKKQVDFIVSFKYITVKFLLFTIILKQLSLKMIIYPKLNTLFFYLFLTLSAMIIF